MTDLLALIVQLSGISARRAGARVAGISVLFALSLLFLLLGMTGLSATLWLLLARVMDPLPAALLMASLCLIIAAILLLVARARANVDHILYGRKKRPEAPVPPDGAVLVLPLVAMAVMGYLLGSRKPKA